MNKYRHPKTVASSGGIIVLMAFVIGILSYVFIKTFILKTDLVTRDIFALLSVILILAVCMAEALAILVSKISDKAKGRT